MATKEFSRISWDEASETAGTAADTGVPVGAGEGAGEGVGVGAGSESDPPHAAKSRADSATTATILRARIVPIIWEPGRGGNGPTASSYRTMGYMNMQHDDRW